MQHPAAHRRITRGVAFLFAIRSTDPDQRSREIALRTLFLGTLGLILVALVVDCVNYFFLQLHYLATRIGIIGILAVVMSIFYYAVLRGRYALASYGLLAFYSAAATIATWQWGIEVPVGVLLFALVVIFSGILLGARYSLYALGLVIGVQTTFVALVDAGTVYPDISWAATSAGFYDVAVFAIILGNMALISWLFNRSMEHSLRRARRSEQALLNQKNLLEVKVEERTREVQEANFERIQELYRFAELGHMGVALLHDMGDYLAVLSLDIEDLTQARQNRSAVIHRVQQSTRRLNNLLGQVRNQIKGDAVVTRFNITDEIDQVVKMLERKASAQQVATIWRQPPQRKRLYYKGSINYFWQVMTNLISNAMDAYDDKHMVKRRVEVTAERTASVIVITITDFGTGIPKTQLEKIFDPFYSTKRNGMGVGLAITKRMIEKDCGGTIQAVSNPKHGTTFTITLPLHAERKKR
jgi:signal transduction histidine kinase